MTPEIIRTLLVVLVAVALLFSERLRVDLIALLVLGGLVLLGLVTPAEALSGFSNPAVVTVWAVFVLSGGLSRTGVDSLAGRIILRLAGSGENRLLVIIMLAAGVMSAFMNNVGVAALLLPVVMNIAQRTGRSPSKLLMPLAYGALLGGLTTLLGTPPNILASDALRDFGLRPFGLFDFTPVGAIVMVSGIAFMVLIGKRLLPERDVRKSLVGAQNGSIRESYELDERLFILNLPRNSGLVGKTIMRSRIGSVTGLNVVGVIRSGSTLLSPEANERLREGDRLLVSGRVDRLEELRKQRMPFEVDDSQSLESLISEKVLIVALGLKKNSRFAGQSLHQLDFRQKTNVNVLAILRDSQPVLTEVQDTILHPDDILVVQTPEVYLNGLVDSTDFVLHESGISVIGQLHELLFAVVIPARSDLDGVSLAESRIRDDYGLNIVAILRSEQTIPMPEPSEILKVGDTMLVEGNRENLALLSGLQGMEVERDDTIDLSILESEQVGLVEAVLSPQTTLVGRTLRDIHFREKYGLSVLAIWRQGRAYRSNLRDMALRFGDALLIHGRRDRLKVLSHEPDFLLLSQEIREMPRLERAPVAGLLMLGVVLSVLFGWLPIAIAAVIGASLMVLTGCLNMEEAYRFIDWRAVFLIAGMLPLGIAMEKSGAAAFLASGMVGALGGLGTTALLVGFFALTALASQFMPNAVVMVLMAPIAINTATGMGLSPYALMMIVAISASASFLSPVGHPANILIMGPGGYTFKDFFKVGLPLTIVVLLVTLVALPVFWPL